ncbi:MAG: hypothetical protein PVF47_08365 [Anaerolineae bacterium]|jgi:hypothetical protein
MGSPHKGNSLEATRRIEEKLACFGDVEFDYVHLFRLRQASYARLETMSPTDYQYWQGKGWLEKETVYFHDNVRPNWLFDRAARVVGWMTGRQIDRALAEVS